MAKLTLDNTEIENEFFSNARLFGIMSQLKSYRFCWQVNACLHYDFRLNTDVEVQLKKKTRIYFFDVYHFYETDGETEHYIYHNYYEGEFLLPEIKHFDFLWLIKTDLFNDEKLLTLQANLKKLNGIQLITELEPVKIKKRANLIL